MVTPDDLAAAVRTKWAASGALNALLPAGRVYQGRAAEATPLPYAVLAVELGETEIVGGSPRVLQKYTLAVTLTTADPPAAAQLAAAAALAGTHVAPGAGLLMPGGRVVHSRLLPAKGTAVTQVRIDGGDLWQATTRLELLVSTLRG